MLKTIFFSLTEMHLIDHTSVSFAQAQHFHPEAILRNISSRDTKAAP